DLSDPQRFNLYMYSRNNPLLFVDESGQEIKYAPNLKNANEVRDTVSAILANPDTAGELSGYVGPNNPDLTIQSSDLSAGDEQVKNPDGTVTTTIVEGQFDPDIQTVTFQGRAPETDLVSATLTIDNRVGKSNLPKVLAHESKHAGDAKRDPAGHIQEVKREQGKPHDQRTNEQRAIKFSKQFSKAINQAAKRIRNERKNREKQEKKKQEEEKKKRKKGGRA
ncbi:MAG: hypothetical protein ACRD2L_17185, partial [Terriglobia bacterium]